MSGINFTVTQKSKTTNFHRLGGPRGVLQVVCSPDAIRAGPDGLDSENAMMSHGCTQGCWAPFLDSDKRIRTQNTAYTLQVDHHSRVPSSAMPLRSPDVQRWPWKKTARSLNSFATSPSGMEIPRNKFTIDWPGPVRSSDNLPCGLPTESHDYSVLRAPHTPLVGPF